MWECQCDCGNIITTDTSCLTRGHSKSCGCLLKDINASNSIHGDSKGGEYHRLYKIWADMKTRCYNENCAAYERYGGSGVEVCNEWQDYLPFKEWALKNGYNEELTIDRIDPFGNYTPGNCRWADYHTQNCNKKNTPRYKFNGEEHSLSEWSEITGINFHTLSNRIHAYKWDIDRALSTPARNKASKGGTP